MPEIQLLDGKKIPFVKSISGFEITKKMPVLSKMIPKLKPKSSFFLHFSEKGWNARNYLFYNRKRGSRHLKSHQNSI